MSKTFQMQETYFCKKGILKKFFPILTWLPNYSGSTFKSDFIAGINPNIEGDNNNSRKVVRGGSWKDVAHFLKVSTRDYEYQNKKRSYIGFRTVQSYLGEDVGFQENPNKIF